MAFAIKGIKAMQQNIANFARSRPPLILQSLYLEGNIEMTEAKKRTPVDVNYDHGRVPPHPGQLRASGTVHEPVQRGNIFSILLSFGGGAVYYAIWVHEIIGNFHPVGQAKFLESVLNESRPFMAERIGRRLVF